MSDQSASPVHARDFGALPSRAYAYGKAPGAYPALPASLPPADAGRVEVPLDELGFFRLTAPSDIAEIHHIRAEIQLPASAVADPGFRAREKKETRKASWGHSSGATNSSAP
jgi:hypothetical protein